MLKEIVKEWNIFYDNRQCRCLQILNIGKVTFFKNIYIYIYIYIYWKDEEHWFFLFLFYEKPTLKEIVKTWNKFDNNKCHFINKKSI